jgi:hypothetical protein
VLTCFVSWTPPNFFGRQSRSPHRRCWIAGLIFASGGGRFAYAQKVPEVVELVRELHGQRQSLRQISKTLAARGHLTGGGRPYTATAVQKMLRAG